MAMEEESLNFRNKARVLLETPSHEGAEILVQHLSMPQETNEFQTARTLFYFCVENFPNRLTVKLLSLYLRSSNVFMRSRSIYLLSDTLVQFRNLNHELSPVYLLEIKPLVTACLTMQETKESDMKYLTRIVSIITCNVVNCDNGGWHELSDCILWLANQEPVKAFHLFIDLPLVYGTFINKFMNIMVEKAEKVLLNPDEVEDWSLALETVVKMGIQLLGKEKRTDLIRKLLNILEKSVKMLVEERMEQFLVRGLEHLERFLSGDKILCSYNKEQCVFVQSFMDLMKDLGTQNMSVAGMEKINQVVKEPVNPATKLISPPVVKPKDDEAEYERGWYDHLKTLSSVDILKIFALNDLEDRTREIAIQRLRDVISDHIAKKVEIDIAEIRELQPLLISCLKQEGISNSMFKVLGEVVSHVVKEMCKHQDVEWCGLRDYIASQSKTNFARAVFILQCLTMPLEEEEFVIPVMENLLPEISIKLNPPRDLLVDNSNWVMAFGGAFCATIRLIKITAHAESVKEIVKKMIDSVSELVERGTEGGLVRRAFKNLEIIVNLQLEWYKGVEFKFVKVLLSRLYAIRGMEDETKIFLLRINRVVDKRVNEELEELRKGKLD